MNAYRRPSGKWQVQIRLGMTDRDVVERFAEVMGCGNIHTTHHNSDHWQAVHTWVAYEAEKVIEAIELLMPFLGIRRRQKAVEVITAARQIQPHNRERTHCPNGHAYTGENLRLEPIVRDGRQYLARRCRVCRREQARNRSRDRVLKAL